jgi:acetyl esterase/lipase
MGITALVLKYRLGPVYRHPAQMNDVQRALRYARFHAESLSYSPDRIGIMGFSAGGHLASVGGTHIALPDADSADPLLRVSSKPDFMILVYPVISLTTEYTHQGSKTNLLGVDPAPELVESLSSELQVTASTPPTFMVLGNDDKAVPAENSILFYQALRKAGVPAEMHIFSRGPHGFGLAPLDSTLSMWPHLCKNWLIDNNFTD